MGIAIRLLISVQQHISYLVLSDVCIGNSSIYVLIKYVTMSTGHDSHNLREAYDFIPVGRSVSF